MDGEAEAERLLRLPLHPPCLVLNVLSSRGQDCLARLVVAAAPAPVGHVPARAGAAGAVARRELCSRSSITSTPYSDLSPRPGSSVELKAGHTADDTTSQLVSKLGLPPVCLRLSPGLILRCGAGNVLVAPWRVKKWRLRRIMREVMTEGVGQQGQAGARGAVAHREVRLIVAHAQVAASLLLLLLPLLVLCNPITPALILSNDVGCPPSQNFLERCTKRQASRGRFCICRYKTSSNDSST